MRGYRRPGSRLSQPPLQRPRGKGPPGGKSFPFEGQSRYSLAGTQPRIIENDLELERVARSVEPPREIGFQAALEKL